MALETSRLFDKLARLMPARLADTDPRFRTPVTLPDDFDAVNADLEAQAPYRRDLVEILRENDGVFDPNGSRG